MYIKILGVPFKSQELWDYILIFFFLFYIYLFYKMLLVSTESSLFYATDFDTEL